MSTDFIPYRKLRTELSRLETLYYACLYAFEVSANDTLQLLKTKRISQTEKIKLAATGFDNKPVSVYPAEFRHRLESQLPRYLREVIFVRLISTLEVYLIEALREAFLERRDLFHSQDKIEFTQGEILSSRSLSTLWTKFINKELRKLQNQGLKEKAKYFKGRLDLDFSKYPEYPDKLSDIHDRRHLLVHRLGKADPQFKKDYNYEKDKVEISHDYLVKSFEIIYSFSDALSNDIVAKIEENDPSKKAEGQYKIKLSIHPKDESVKGILSTDFCFAVEDDVVMLSDLIESYQSSSDQVEMTLVGNMDEIKNYIKMLKKHERRGALDLTRQTALGSSSFDKKPRKCLLPSETIREIAEGLPAQPWPQGIHKRIAKHYNTSNRQISAAIETILSSEELTLLIGKNSKFS